MAVVGFWLATTELVMEVAVLVMVLITFLGTNLFYTVEWASIVESIMAAVNLIMVLVAVLVPYSEARGGVRAFRMNPFTLHFVWLFFAHGIFLICYWVLFQQCGNIGPTCSVTVFPVFNTGVMSLAVFYVHYVILLGLNFLLNAGAIASYFVYYYTSRKDESGIVPKDRRLEMSDKRSIKKKASRIFSGSAFEQLLNDD